MHWQRIVGASQKECDGDLVERQSEHQQRAAEDCGAYIRQCYSKEGLPWIGAEIRAGFLKAAIESPQPSIDLSNDDRHPGHGMAHNNR